MNRIILIGNGFDLAHGLKTSYKDFINWYFYQCYNSMQYDYKYCDDLWTVELERDYEHGTYVPILFNDIKYNGVTIDKFNAKTEFFDRINKNPDKYKKEVLPKEFLKRICQDIDNKNWEGIESTYYDLLKESVFEKKYNTPSTEELNKQLVFLQKKLIEYLKEVDDKPRRISAFIEKEIHNNIYSRDLSIDGVKIFKEHIREQQYKRETHNLLVKTLKNNNIAGGVDLGDELRSLGDSNLSKDYFQAKQTMVLNFNYTHTIELLYFKKVSRYFSMNHIHGVLNNPNNIIFGYGDELDSKYQEISELGNNECLTNIKSVRYLETDNYRKMLSFIESEPYQVYIMGHSCGRSDRTLLNTLFEHKNCVSIKPYYYKKEDGTDNYSELVQNISRNFTDMKLFRDRVVNKTYCEPLSDDSNKIE